MQYLLTSEEMDVHRQQIADMSRLPSPKKLQEFCSRIADTLVLTEGFGAGHPWGCILTTSPRNYCDHCPAQEACPNQDKSWSK